MKTVQTKIPNKETKSNYYKMHIEDIKEIDQSIADVLEFLHKIMNNSPHSEELYKQYDEENIDCRVSDLEGFCYDYGWFTKL